MSKQQQLARAVASRMAARSLLPGALGKLPQHVFDIAVAPRLNQASLMRLGATSKDAQRGIEWASQQRKREDTLRMKQIFKEAFSIVTVSSARELGPKSRSMGRWGKVHTRGTTLATFKRPIPAQDGGRLIVMAYWGREYPGETGFSLLYTPKGIARSNYGRTMLSIQRGTDPVAWTIEYAPPYIKGSIGTLGEISAQSVSVEYQRQIAVDAAYAAAAELGIRLVGGQARPGYL